VVVGIVLSYYLDLAPSGTIVMISVAILVATLVAKYLGLVGKSTPITKTI
jgi:zinc transport system permease protein